MDVGSRFCVDEPQKLPVVVRDEEWEFVIPYLCLMVQDAPRREHDLREVFKLVRSGAPYRSFTKSRPAPLLTGATLLVVALTLVFPFTPLGRMFGFAAVPLSFVALMGLIMALYIGAAELTKHVFYAREAGRKVQVLRIRFSSDFP